MDGNPGTEQRSSLLRGKIIRNSGYVRRGRFHKFSISAVHGHTSNLLLNAKVLVAFPAKLTFSAGPMDPGHADAVSDLRTLHSRTDLNNRTDHFVPKNKRLLDDPSQLRPVAVRDMQVGVTHAANFHLDQNFAL